MNPSSMGLGKFCNLVERIQSKQCSFKHLMYQEWLEQQEKFNDDVASGTSTLPVRKTQSDTGKKRGNRTERDEVAAITSSATKVSLINPTARHVPVTLML